MRRIILSALLLLAATGVALTQTPPAGGPPGGGRGGPGRTPMMLSSPAVEDGGVVPDKYTAVAGPAAVTVPLSWSNVPATAQSLVLIVHDVDVVMGRGLGDNPHWIVFNIPPTATSLPESPANMPTLPAGAMQMGRPGRGGAPASMGYFPFAPPPGFAHHYNFDLYALDIKLPLDSTATRDDIQKAMEGHVVGKAVIETRFKR